jgi:hypothetical protein
MRWLRRSLSLAFCCFGYLACVDDSSPNASSGGPADSGSAQQDGNVVPTDSGAPRDAAACPADYGNCDRDEANGCETDLRISSDHCGACGRACGGTACIMGQCAPQEIVKQIAQPYSFLAVGGRIVYGHGLEISGCLIGACPTTPPILVDLHANGGQPAGLPTGLFNPRLLHSDGTNFYFAQCLVNSNNDCVLSQCALGGCKSTGASPLTSIAQAFSRRPFILANGGSAAGDPGIFMYHSLEGLIRYAPPFTPNATVTERGVYPLTDVTQAIYADRSFFLWVDSRVSVANPDGGVYRCASGGCAGGATKILPPPVKHIAGNAGVIYTSFGPDNNSAILSCNIAGCSQTGTILANNQPYVSDIAVDANAIYWATTGTANPGTNNVAGGRIWTCKLPSCQGGPQVIAEAQLNPMQIQLDENYVYWMNRGAANQASGSIWRRRR